MRFVRLGGVVVLALGLAACPGDDRTAAVDQPVGMTDTMMAPPATTQPGMGTDMERVELRPLAGRDVSGEATFSASGQGTQVMVRLTGGMPGAKSGHIHSGTCANIGAVVFPLESVNTQQGGTSTSTVNAPLDQVMNGEHLIAYHEAGGNPGAPVVCGEIPRHGAGMGM